MTLIKTYYCKIIIVDFCQIQVVLSENCKIGKRRQDEEAIILNVKWLR